MRFVEGRAQTIGGWTRVFGGNIPGLCRNVHNWTNIAGVPNIAFGSHNALRIQVGGMFSDITPSGLMPGAIDTSGGGPGYGTDVWSGGTYSVPSSAFNLRTWSLDSWGETLLAVPRGGTLYQWTNDPGTAAAAIAAAPGEITAMLVTPERQVLALGCTEEISNDFNPLCIRGCDIENPNDWTTASSNNAFEHVLEGGGQILAGRMVGPFVAIWTDNSLHQGQFLGNPDQTYRFDRIDANCGVLGPNAVCIQKGAAYWVGKDRQIRTWIPGSRPMIIPCPIWRDFADHLHNDQAAKLIAVSNSRFDEVWFFYPDARDGNENSRYIALSTSNGCWFRGRLARTAACDAGVLPYPIAVTATGIAYHHEIGSDADGLALSWSARSAAQFLSEGERVLQVQGMQPDFKEQEQDVLLTIYTRKQAQSPARVHGPYRLRPGTAKKDFRVTGAIIELEFAGRGYARFGRPTFDAIATGAR
jgi:hypothetical protein